MAEENTATSAHLDSFMHVYDNGTTARLYVSPWDRNTVADGYWQTVNTIQPLINRDVYLADCIDKLAEKYTVYTEGEGIKITQNLEPSGTYSIGLSPDYYKKVPKYEFDTDYFVVSSNPDTNETKIGLKLDPNSGVGYISADENGIFANLDDMMYSTSSITSVSTYSGNYTSAWTYTYSTADLTVEYVTMLPEDITEAEKKLYIVG